VAANFNFMRKQPSALVVKDLYRLGLRLVLRLLMQMLLVATSATSHYQVLMIS
jgi:hypothetical protein